MLKQIARMRINTCLVSSNQTAESPRNRKAGLDAAQVPKRAKLTPAPACKYIYGTCMTFARHGGILIGNHN